MSTIGDTTHPSLEPARILLICCGAGRDAVLTALTHVRPARVLFWHSEPTREDAMDSLQRAGYDPGKADYRRVTRKRDLQACVADMRSLYTDYLAWVRQSPGHRVLFDFAGGTAAMSAAMALVAHRWDCQFLYLGVPHSPGTGLTGSETPVDPVQSIQPAFFRRPRVGRHGIDLTVPQTLQKADPYDSLAYQPLQDAVELFNLGQPRAASQMLEAFARRTELAAAARSKIVAVQALADAYALWDTFRHSEAADKIDETIQSDLDLNAAIPRHGLLPTLKRHLEVCRGLDESRGKPSRELVFDLLANADRRAGNERFDDAAARLCRAAEAMAQLALSSDHQIDAGAVRLGQLPKRFAAPWKSRAEPDGSLKLGMPDAYAVLHELKHPLGLKFRQQKLHEPASPFAVRDGSMLGHGFAPVSGETFRALRDVVHELAGAPDLAAFTFPLLPMP